MNKFSVFTLKGLRKIYSKAFGKPILKPESEQNPDIASQIIYDTLMSDKPCMIARFGSNELLCLVTYLGIKKNNRNVISFVTGKSFEWWWNEENLQNMHLVAGFFPPKISKFEQFCELMLQDIPEVNVLGSWLENERMFDKELCNSKKVWLLNLEPFWAIQPWTKALEGKKVLVVHPFAKTIESQYKKRNLIFPNNLLPDFELITFKAIQSNAAEKTVYNDWFEALDYMKAEIDKIDYDICLIGCGAYGFHLAAHVKRMGKKSFHLGGSLQLLFGIRGKRWETGLYKTVYNYDSLTNDYWVRPDESEKPKESYKVEGSCYW